MKHTWSVTGILITFFVLAQLVGLALVSHVTPSEAVPPTNTESAGRGGMLLLGIGLGTVLLLAIVKLNLQRVWKAWFFLAVWLAMGYALDVLLPSLVALGIALALAAWKIMRPNVLVHNITEILVYSGIAVIVAGGFALNLLFASLLLIAISAYDAYAVWRSKHMVTLANFQTQSKLFAGLLVPYHKDKGPQLTGSAPKAAEGQADTRTAVLGGGDIAFPMIFGSAALQWLVAQDAPRALAYLFTLPVVAFAAASLFLLFYFAKSDRFYPAMPFISAGCFAGLAVTALLWWMI